MYDIIDIDWNDEDRLEIGWRRQHRFLLKFIAALGIIGVPLLGGFLAVSRDTFGPTEWMFSAIPLLLGGAVGGVISLLLPTVTVDRNRGVIEVGAEQLSFEDVSVISVVEQRSHRGGRPKVNRWFSVVATDTDGQNWKVETSRQRHRVEQLRDLLVDELDRQGIDADWK